MEANCLRMPSSKERDCIQNLTSDYFYSNDCWDMLLSQHQTQIQQALRELRESNSYFAKIIPENVNRMTSDYEWDRHLLAYGRVSSLLIALRKSVPYKHLFHNFSAELLNTSYNCSCNENYRFADADSNIPHIYKCVKVNDSFADWVSGSLSLESIPVQFPPCIQGARVRVLYNV